MNSVWCQNKIHEPIGVYKMSSVILQPTGNKDAREHYVDTLIRPVDILRIKLFVTED